MTKKIHDDDISLLRAFIERERLDYIPPNKRDESNDEVKRAREQTVDMQMQHILKLIERRPNAVAFVFQSLANVGCAVRTLAIDAANWPASGKGVTYLYVFDTTSPRQLMGMQRIETKRPHFCPTIWDVPNLPKG